MDIKDAEKQIHKADSLLTTFWKFLGRHWGKLIVIGLLFLGYKFCVLVGEEIKIDQQREIEQLKHNQQNP